MTADAASVRDAVIELIALPRRGFVEYEAAHEYADGVFRAAAAIDALIEAGGAGEAIELAREAIDLFTEVYGYVDDSSGSVGSAAYELLAVHLRACEAAPPEPVSLGSYLVRLLLRDEHGFEPYLGHYGELLGDSGVATVHAGTGPRVTMKTCSVCAAPNFHPNERWPTISSCARQRRIPHRGPPSAKRH